MPKGDDQNQGMDVVQFGLMNALRTGNAAFDMLVVVLVPIIMAFAANLVRYAHPWYIKSYTAVRRMGRTEYVRTLRRATKLDSWDAEEGKEKHNHILQKAVTMYLSTERTSRLNKSKHASLVLSAIGKEKSSGQYSWNKTYGNSAEQLEQYIVSTRLPENTWVEVDDGVEFQLTVNDPSEDERNQDQNAGDTGGPGKGAIITDFTFRSSRRDGKERVSRFLATAVKWYKAQVSAQTDKSRYLYIMQMSGSGGDDDDDEGGGGEGPAYKRYKLSDAKTFDSLFFPQKGVLLDLLNNFQKKVGKFAIPGFPHKLGLLLHGPPGTGKTSLIKALAQHTGRSIVSIPLARIKTNQELMDCEYCVLL